MSIFGVDKTAREGAGYDWGMTRDAAQREGSMRTKQFDAMSELEAAAKGRGPSVADQQLKATLEANKRQQMAMARSAAGGALGAGAAQMSAQQNAALMQQQAAGQGALLRAQEMAANRQAWADYMLQQRAQDQSLLELTQNRQLGIGQTNAQLEGAAAQRDAAQAQAKSGLIGGVAAMGAAGVGLMSDERQKENIQPAQGASSWLEDVEPVTYEYRDPAVAESGGELMSVDPRVDPYTTGDPSVEPARPRPNLPGRAIEGMRELHTAGAAGTVLGVPGVAVRLAQTKSPMRARAAMPEVREAMRREKIMRSAPEGQKPTETGVIAQDLERTPEGSRMVVETERGKAIDPARAVGPILAAEADIARRLSAVEGQLRSEPIRRAVSEATRVSYHGKDAKRSYSEGTHMLEHRPSYEAKTAEDLIREDVLRRWAGMSPEDREIFRHYVEGR